MTTFAIKYILRTTALYKEKLKAKSSAVVVIVLQKLLPAMIRAVEVFFKSGGVLFVVLLPLL
jgi:hypothetical protein